MLNEQEWDELNAVLAEQGELSPEELAAAQRESRIEAEEKRQEARREAIRRLDAKEQGESTSDVRVASLSDELSVEDTQEDWFIHSLLPDGGRSILGGFRKTGKSTVMLNLLKSLAQGTLFMGLFSVRQATATERVVYLNLELTDKMCRRWLKKMSFDSAYTDRISIVHARGATRRFNVITPEGRTYFTDLLKSLSCRVLVVDPVAPLMAASGLNSMYDNEVSMFFMRMDEIAASAGVTEIIYVAHVGKGAEPGMETVKGSTRWEDAVDAIWTTGRATTDKHAKRWFSAEVRGGEGAEIEESEIVFDSATLEVSIATTFGKHRHVTALDDLKKKVLEYVSDHPGVKKGDLMSGSAITGKNIKIGAAVSELVSEGRLRVEERKGAQHHYVVDPTPFS